MKAFHDSQEIKDKYVTRVKHHIELDNLVRGTGWSDGKGCAVGCTLEAYNHEAYETELGIPEWLARLEDTLFERMSEEKSRTWPLRFLEAISVGADLEKVKAPFLTYILKQCLTYFDNEKNPEVTEVIKRVIYLYSNPSSTRDEFRAAAWEAATEADSWATGASSMGAVWAAETAARSADAEADSWSGRNAVSRAAEAAAEAARAADSRAIASARAYNKYADKLLKLLLECK